MTAADTKIEKPKPPQSAAVIRAVEQSAPVIVAKSTQKTPKINPDMQTIYQNPQLNKKPPVKTQRL